MSDQMLMLITQLSHRVDKLDEAIKASESLDFKFWLPVIISCIAIIVSIALAIYAKKSSAKIQEENQKQMNLQAVKTSIAIAKNDVQSITITLAPLKAKEKNHTLDADQTEELNLKKAVFETTVEQLLNSYEDGCDKFYKNQVNKQDFMDAFHMDIARYVQEFKESFQPPLTSYHQMLKYYQEKHQQPRA